MQPMKDGPWESPCGGRRQTARQRIATLRECGHGVQEVARRLDRSASTVLYKCQVQDLIGMKSTRRAASRLRAVAVIDTAIAGDTVTRDMVKTHGFTDSAKAASAAQTSKTVGS